MSVNTTLRTAIWCRRPVEMLAAGHVRKVCPHALGRKDDRLKVLVFQFFGGSEAALPSGGLWRSFFLDQIAWAKIINGPWRTGQSRVLKVEIGFDHVELEARSRASASRRGARSLVLHAWPASPGRELSKEKPSREARHWPR